MTTITIDRATVEQALEALEKSGCVAFKGLACRCNSTCASYTAAVALRAALAQQGEPVVRGAAYVDALRWTIKACGAVQRDDGVWFGDDAAARLARVLSEGIATPQQAEPVEPGARIRTWHKDGEQHAELRVWEDGIEGLPDGEHLLYTAPPQRKPLTDEEIEAAAKSVPAAVYELMHGHEITVGRFRAALAEVARAVERAHGIREGA